MSKSDPVSPYRQIISDTETKSTVQLNFDTEISFFQWLLEKTEIVCKHRNEGILLKGKRCLNLTKLVNLEI